MNSKDKAALTRVTNQLRKWNQKYLSNTSPYIVNQYRKASTKYNEVVNRLKDKYRGQQVNLQL